MPNTGCGLRIGTLALMGLMGGLPTLPAQTLAQRVAGVRDGAVQFTFAARPGVAGDGHGGITWPCGPGGPCGRRLEAGQIATACDSGPVRVTLTKRGAAVVAATVEVGGFTQAPNAGTTDLGPVAARAAAAYLTELARTGSERVGREAVFAATLADSVTVWPDLLTLAREDGVPAETRKAAVFWVSQMAGVAITRGLTDLVEGADAQRDIQEAAVFALSQRPPDEGVPALIGVARSHRDPRIRRQAIFWLGQTRDPRALAFFEEILTGS